MLCVQQAMRSPCLPEPPSWGGLGAAVLAVRPRQEEFPELAPVWLHLGLGLTDLLGAAFFSIRTPRKRNSVLCPPLESSSPAAEPGCRSMPGIHSRPRAEPDRESSPPVSGGRESCGPYRRVGDAPNFPRPRRAQGAGLSLAAKAWREFGRLPLSHFTFGPFLRESDLGGLPSH